MLEASRGRGPPALPEGDEVFNANETAKEMREEAKRLRAQADGLDRAADAILIPVPAKRGPGRPKGSTNKPKAGK